MLYLQAMMLGRAIHENVNHTFKSLGALQQMWWYMKHKYDKNFEANSTITQLGIKSDHPLFQIDRYEDCVVSVLL